jgi:hypothetical protein
LQMLTNVRKPSLSGICFELSNVPFIEYLNITNDWNNVMKFMLPVV